MIDHENVYPTTTCGAMEKDRLFKPREVYRMLGINDSTLRRYAVKFSAHLSRYTKGRSRKYTLEDIAVLKRAIELANEGHTLDEVERLLYVRGADPGNVNELVHAPTLASLPELVDLLTEVRDEYRSLRMEFRQQFDEQGTKIDALHQEYRREHERLRRNERIQLMIYVGLFLVAIVIFLVLNAKP